ncbi:MAG: putative Ig domain-containing protein, partial [Verrucomicrobiota bacterium]
PMPGDWVYLRVPDPGTGQYHLTRVTRSDGVEIPVETNVWTTDRTFIGLSKRPIRENILHLLDYNSTGSYTLTYEPGLLSIMDIDPPISSVTNLPSASQPYFQVRWSGRDDGPLGQAVSGIAFYDIFVSENGGPFVPWLQQTHLVSATYVGALGSHYAFYSVATDANGNRESAPGIADAETLVSLTNLPPVLTLPELVTIDEGETLDASFTASDPDVDQTLTFALLPGAPPGILLESESRRLTWATGEGNGPSTNRVRVVARDSGFPSLSATSSVTVIVREVNTAPVLNLFTNRIIAEGFLLNIANVAQDFDLPAQPLTFSLVSGSPTNATINPTSGLFTWRPTELQGGTTNQFSIIVKDNGNPPLGATQTFSVIVRDTKPDFVFSIGTTQLLSGATGSVPLTLQSGTDITNLHLVLALAGDRLTNLTLQSLAPEVISADFFPLGSNRFDIQFRGQLNAPLQGDLKLAQLGFATVTNEHSAVGYLKGEFVQGLTGSASTLLNGSIGNGRIFIIGREPILDSAATTNRRIALTIYGLPGKRYAKERHLGLNKTNTWDFVDAVTVDANKTELPPFQMGNEMEFFRLYELPESNLKIKVIGNQMFIDWPVDCVGCVLEETSILNGTNTVWMPSPLQPQVINERYQVQMPIGTGAKFLRLAIPTRGN